MRLYDLIKDRLKEPQGVISDNEMIALNRRDFIYAETSSTSAFLRLFHAEGVTYEMYSIVDYLHSVVCKARDPSFLRITQLSKSMTVPSLAVSVFAGDLVRGVEIHAPRGLQPVSPIDSFAKDLHSRFLSQIKYEGERSDSIHEQNTIDFIFANASNEAEVTSGLKAFEKVNRGLILIKGYGRLTAPNCGELILGARLNVHCSIAGFGVCTAL